MRVLGLLLLGLYAPAAAAAAPGEPKAAPEVAPDPDAEPEQPLIPPAADKLGGHLVGAAHVGWMLPFGDLAEGTSGGNLGSAFGLGVDLGYGISRTLVIGAWGQYGAYSESPDCGGCTGKTLAVGPFVRYHLVQGMRFDPWLLGGIGYRSLSVDTELGTADYSGVEWLRVAVGGDYYALSGFGFGPLIDFSLGVFGKYPDSARTAAVHFNMLFGLRLVLDVPGR